MSAARKKVVFFSPHSGIWPHALPESFLAKCLDSSLFETARLTCDRTFNSHCNVMEASGVTPDHSPQEKESICRNCVANSRILRASYRGEDWRISDFLRAEEIEEAEEAESRLTRENIQTFTYQGVEVGKIASYDILLRYKKTSLTFGDSEFAHYKIYVKNALLALLAFRHFHDEWKPDIMISYSPQYGVNGVCARYCELHGTRAYLFEGSSNIAERYKAMRVWDWTAFGLTNPALKHWHELGREGLTREDVDRAERHTKSLITARSFSVYSEPASHRFDVRAHFGIPSGAKVLLAALSSYDEVFSAVVINRFPLNKFHSEVFPDQMEWIRQTIPFLASHPELFLVIRIHPRTFPNKRESIMAPEQKELAALLADLPPNVRANYPSDKISIYDFYNQIDTLVTGWSATGVEAMTCGVPVVTYDRNLPSYPDSIHFSGDTREEYFENILTASAAGRSPAVSEIGYRWMAFSMSVGVVRHPAPLSETAIVTGSKAGHFLYRGLNWMAPRLLKRLDAGRRMSSKPEVHRLNSLFATGGNSLYDIPRLPE